MSMTEAGARQRDKAAVKAGQKAVTAEAGAVPHIARGAHPIEAADLREEAAGPGAVPVPHIRQTARPGGKQTPAITGKTRMATEALPGAGGRFW